jgi:membrane-bound metal-dependent hydrolase YbcI (DUF457 family)
MHCEFYFYHIHAVIFVPLLLSGAETIEPIDGRGYGKMIIHADYTHSLIGALLLALLAGWLAKRLWGRRGGIVISSMVFSHWLLDLLVHRADLPILPGNPGNLLLLGFQLRNTLAFQWVSNWCSLLQA